MCDRPTCWQYVTNSGYLDRVTDPTTLAIASAAYRAAEPTGDRGGDVADDDWSGPAITRLEAYLTDRGEPGQTGPLGAAA